MGDAGKSMNLDDHKHRGKSNCDFDTDGAHMNRTMRNVRRQFFRESNDKQYVLRGS